VSREGAGLHKGELAKLTLAPAPWGTGLVFVVGATPVPATLDFARAEPGCTVLARASSTVYTPEHLLAALCALGITDVFAMLEGPEVPALDGSARGWVEAVDEVGRSSGPPLALRSVEAPIEVAGWEGRAWLGPGAELSVEVDFEDGPVGTLSVPQEEAAFRRDIMWARTFVLARDVERLRAAGRGKGANADNTLVWPQGLLRAPDEPIRHKLLDAWGDLALLGPCQVAMRVQRGSHALHQALLREAVRGS
jgi:UDP-3-O-[3-hydroxymyristoyl] N-acetylglucosamine deacetylase